MPYYKFKENEILHNTLETHPEVQFDVNAGNIYLNNRNAISGAFVGNVGCAPVGNLSLYEINVDRPADSLAYPFVTKDGSFEAVGSVSLKDYFSSFEYGDSITGSYPMSASLAREHFVANHGTLFPTGSHVSALRTALNYYQPLSNHYAYSSSLGDKAVQELSLLYVPSIFYGSKIYPGTTTLQLYISGTLAAEAQDLYRNGELIQVSGSALAQTNGSGSVAGVILYNEGVVVLTGSWGLTVNSFARDTDSGPFRWIDFALGANDGSSDITPSASFRFKFEGTNPIETLTMFATAPRSELNFSANQTLLDKVSYDAATNQPQTGSYHYKESENIEIFNTVSSSFYRFEADFKHQTFINKIGIYDKNKNLIAVANLATPIKKTALRDFTFKLKLDI
jgi:hypothetical protein